jgi:hypothetical protein
MRTRYMVLLVALGVAVGLVAWACIPTPRPSRPLAVDVSLQNVDRLKLNMSEAEVEAVLGAPAGDYRTRNDIGHIFAASGAWSRSPGGSVTKQWVADEASVLIRFDPGEGATIVSRGIGIGSPTWGERQESRLRNLLGLPSRRPWIGR